MLGTIATIGHKVGVYFVYFSLVLTILYIPLVYYLGPTNPVVKLLSAIPISQIPVQPTVLHSAKSGVVVNLQYGEYAPVGMDFWTFLKIFANILGNVVTGGGLLFYKMALLIPNYGPVLASVALVVCSFFNFCGWCYLIVCGLLRRC